MTATALDWLLTDFVDRLPDVTGALISTTDGLKVHQHGLQKEEVDTLSAVCSGMISLGRQAGGGAVRQVVTEGDEGLVFLTAAGEGTNLMVLATPNADVGPIGYEITQLITSVRSHLSSPARHASSAGPVQ
ncbi:roadblock/LC7 domain-containing protein [Streptomyces sp. NPDC058280]|uniref:roadblock/LC7 domain-containing protein n=1 Tax=Streptomyces sp. NPDC058280 TaxID=3346419 RepID=UPI0036E233A9